MTDELNELRIDIDGFEDVTMRSISSHELTNTEKILVMCLTCKKTMQGTRDHVTNGFLPHVCGQLASTDDFVEGIHMTIDALQLEALNPIWWPSNQQGIPRPFSRRESSIRVDSEHIPGSTNDQHGLVASTPKKDVPIMDAVGYV